MPSMKSKSWGNLLSLYLMIDSQIIDLHYPPPIDKIRHCEMSVAMTQYFSPCLGSHNKSQDLLMVLALMAENSIIMKCHRFLYFYAWQRAYWFKNGYPETWRHISYVKEKVKIAYYKGDWIFL